MATGRTQGVDCSGRAAASKMGGDAGELMPIDFITIPAAVLQIKGLSLAQKMLLALILAFGEKGLRMSNASLGELLDIRADSVGRLLAGLHRENYIEIGQAQSRWRVIYLGKKAEVEEILLRHLSRDTSAFKPSYLGKNAEQNIKKLKKLSRFAENQAPTERIYNDPTPEEVDAAMARIWGAKAAV